MSSFAGRPPLPTVSDGGLGASLFNTPGSALLGHPGPNDSSERAPELEALSGKLALQFENRLKKALSVVSAHLESCIERRIQESHDGIAARIEDVAAAEVERSHARLRQNIPAWLCCSPVEHEEPNATVVHHSASTPSTSLEMLVEQCRALQQRQDDLDAMVNKVAANASHDSVAASSDVGVVRRELLETRREVQAFIRPTNNVLDQLATEVCEIKRIHDEDCRLITESYEKLRSWMWSTLDSIHASVTQKADVGVHACDPGRTTSTSSVVEPASVTENLFPQPRLATAEEIEIDKSKEVALGEVPQRKVCAPVSRLESSGTVEEATEQALAADSSLVTPVQMEDWSRQPESEPVSASPWSSADARDLGSPTTVSGRDLHLGGAKENSAVASLSEWLAESSARPGHSQPPTRDLIRAAARELVCIARSETKRAPLDFQHDADMPAQGTTPRSGNAEERHVDSRSCGENP